MDGWITLHRKFQDWEWYTAPNHAFLFVHLLLKANHKSGKWRGHNYKRGDVLTSLSKLSEETGLSKQNIRTILKNLANTGEVNTLPNTKLTHLSICKYDTYQNKDELPNTLPNTELTQSQHSPNTVLTTNNNDNNYNNDNNDNNIKDSLSDDKSSDAAHWLKKANPVYLRDCENFYKILMEKDKITKSQNWKTKTWHDGFRLLIESDGVDYDKEFKPVMNFYIKNIGKQFCPEAYSPTTVRTKWVKLRDYMNKEKNKPNSNLSTRP